MINILIDNVMLNILLVVQHHSNSRNQIAIDQIITSNNIPLAFNAHNQDLCPTPNKSSRHLSRDLRRQFLHSDTLECIQSLHHMLRRSHSSKDSTFHFDGIQRAGMQRWFSSGTRILYNDTVKASIICFAHRCGYADICSHAREKKVLDTLVAEQ